MDKYEMERRLNASEELIMLRQEIEPYAVRLEPEVVMNKSTPSLSHLAEWVEKFLTIMRRKVSDDGNRYGTEEGYDIPGTI